MNMTTNTTDDLMMRVQWDDKDLKQGIDNALKLLTNMGKKIGDIEKTSSDSLSKIADAGKKGFESLGKQTESLGKSIIGTFSGVSESIGKLNFEQLGSAIEGVSSHFTLFGRIGEEALGRIANAVVDVGSHIAGMVNDLTLKPIASGFEEYGLLMDSTQVILANTGEDLGVVDDALEELNHYADRTIYNFGHMTQAIGKFTAAGVGLDDSVAAIQGLSNLSAMVGVDAAQNSRAMDALSQALSSGALKQRQWLRFEATGGLAGSVFRDNLIKTAEELGYFSRAWTDASGKGIDGAELMAEAQTSFRDTLKYGWVDDEVLLTTLAKFTDEETELGQQAFKAATEVRTWSKLWDALQEAVQSSWSETFKYIFGDYEQGTQFWTAINDEVSKFIGLIGDSRNDMLEIWNESGGRQDVLDGLAAAWGRIKDAITPVVDVLKNNFNWLNLEAIDKATILDEASANFKAWAESLQVSDEFISKISNITQAILTRVNVLKDYLRDGGLDNILYQIGGIARIVINIADAIASIFNQKFGKNFGAINTAITHITYSITRLVMKWEKFTNSDTFKEIVKDISGIFTPIQKLITLLNKANYDYVIQTVNSALKIALTLLRAVGKAVDNVFKKFKPLYDVGGEKNLIEKALGFLGLNTKTESKLTDFFKKIRNHVVALRKYITESTTINKITKIIEGFIYGVKLILDAVTQVGRYLDHQIFGGNRIIKFLDHVLTIGSAISDWVRLLDQVVTKYDLIYKAMDLIHAFLDPFINLARNTLAMIFSGIEDITGIDIPWVEDGEFIFGGTKGKQALFKSIKETKSNFESLAETFNTHFDEIKSKVQTFANTIVAPLGASIELIGAILGTALEAVSQAIEFVKTEIIGISDTDALGSTVESITEGLKLFTTWVSEIKQVITENDIVYKSLDVIVTFLTPFLVFLRDTLGFVFRTIAAITGVDIPWLTGVPVVWEDTAENVEATKNAFADFLQSIDFESLKRNAGKVSNAIVKGLTAVRDALEWVVQFLDSNDILDKLVTPFKLLYEHVSHIDFSPIVSILRDILEIGAYIIGAFSKAVEDVFKFSGETSTLSRILSGIADAVHNIKEAWVNDWGFAVLRRGFSGVLSIIRLVLDVVFQIVEAAMDYLDKVKPSLDAFWSVAMTIFGGVIQYFGDIFRWLERMVRHTGLIKNLLSVIMSFVAPIFNAVVGLGKAVGVVFEQFTGFKITDIFSNLATTLGGAKKHFVTFGDFLTEKLGKLNEIAAESGNSIAQGIGNFALDLVTGEDVFSKTMDYWGGKIEDFKTWRATKMAELFKEDGSVNFENADSFSDYAIIVIEKIKSTFEKGISFIVKKVQEFMANPNFGNLIKTAKDVITSIWNYISTGIKNFFDNLFKNPETIDADDTAEAAAEAVETVADGVVDGVVTGIQEGIDSSLSGEGKIPLINYILDKLGDLSEKIFGVRNPIALIREKLKPVTDFMSNLFNAIATFFKGDYDAVTVDTVIDRLEDLVFLKSVLRISSFFGSMSDAIDSLSKVFSAGAKDLKKLKKHIKPLMESAKGVIDAVKGGITKISKSISDMFTAFGKAAEKLAENSVKIAKNFDKALVKMNKQWAKTARKFAKGWTKISKGIESFLKNAGKSARDIAKGTKRYLTGEAINAAATGILKFAIAVLLIVGAIWLVAQIPTEDLIKGGVVVGIIAVVLLVIAAAFVKLTQSKNRTEQAADGLSGLGSIFSGLKESLDKALGDIGDGFKKGGIALILLAFAAVLSQVISGIKMLAGLDWDDVVKGVGGMSVAMIALAASLAIIFASTKKNKNQKGMSVREVLGMLVMVIAVKTLAEAIVEIGDLEMDRAVAGMAAISVAMLAFAGSMAIIFATTKKGGGQSGTTVRDVLAMLAMVLAIKVLSDAVVKLGGMEEGLWKGVAAVAVISIVFDGMMVVSRMTRGVSVWPILALVAALWVMIEGVTKFARMNPERLTRATLCLDSLMGMFALLNFSTYGIDIKKVLSSIALMGVAIGLIAGVLYLLNENIRDPFKFKVIADGLSETLLSMVAALGVCAFIGTKVQDDQAVINGIKYLDMFIADIAVVMGALGGVVNWLDSLGDGGMATAAFEKAAEVMKLLGEAIGNFVGGIVGGIFGEAIDVIGKHLESFGTSLSTFSDNAGPFFDKMSTIGKDSFTGLAALADAMLKLTANDLLSTLNIFKSNDNPYAKFADALDLIGPAIATYSQEIKDVKTKKVINVTKALSEIVDVAKKIPNEGGAVADIFGDNTLSQFAVGLTDFTGPFAAYLETVSAVAFDENNVSKAISLADATVEFAKKIPKEGGFFGDVFGEGDLSTFAEDLENFVGPFTGYLEKVSAATFSEETVAKSTALAEGIAGFASKITDVQALNALGDADIGPLEQFGKDLVAFAPHFVNYLNQISAAGFNADVVANSNAFADSLAGLSDKVQGKAGILTSLFVGDNSLSGIGTGLDTFSSAIGKFSDNLKGVVWEDIDKAISILNDIGKAAEDHSDGLNTLAFTTFDDGLVSITRVVAILRDSIKQALTNDDLNTAAESDARTVGESIQNGIKDGFDEANKDSQNYGRGGITSALNEALLNAIDSTKLFLGISGENNGRSSTFFNLAVNTIAGLIDGINDQADELASAAEGSASGLVTSYTDEAIRVMNNKQPRIRTNVVQKSREAIELLATTVINTFNNNKESMGTTAYNTFFDMASQGAFAIANKYEDFFNMGVYIVNGFINGINSKAQAAVDAVANLGNASVNTLANSIDAHSPSRAAFALGQFFDSGYIQGIVSKGSDVLNAVKTTFTKPIDAISSLLNGEIEYTPTIRPIVDMSDVHRSSGVMNSLFGEKSVAVTENAMLMSETSRANKAKEASSRLYNDRRVVNAINGLRGDVNGMQAAMGNMGLYIDGDALVGRITDRMDRTLAANQIRRKRGI